MTQRPLYALLVGITRYASPTVPDLAGCENDVLAVRDLLQDHFGVAPDGITVLLNEAATREAIRTAFRDQLLAPLQTWAAQRRPDDGAQEQPAVLFYFSGHGSQAPAADELAGVDETLVPHDSRVDGRYDIKDRELRSWLAEVSQYTTNVTVILDCCHSGSGTRLDKKQLTYVRACPPDDRPAQPLPSTLGPTLRGALVQSAPDHLDHVLLAACRNDEKAREEVIDRQWHGIFTYWLLNALRQQPVHQPLTYRDLADQVRHQLQRTYGSDAQRAQTPQCEGDRDRLFLGDLRPVKGRWLRVVDERDGLIWVDSGQAQGMSVGAILHLYAPETATTAQKQEPPLAIVEVDSVEATQSSCVRLDPQPWSPLPPGTRAFVYNYGKTRHRVKVALDLPEGMVLNTVRDRLLQPDIYPEIELALATEGAALRLAKQGETFEIQSGNRQQCYQRYDTRQLNPYRRPLVAKDLDPVVQDLLHLVKQAQIGAIASEPGSEIVADLQLRLDRLLPSTAGNPSLSAPVDIDEQGNHLLPVDTPLRLQITNGYAKALYITILALGYKGDVTRVYPQIAGANEAVAPGKTLVIGQGADPHDQLIMRLPPGIEQAEERLKVIATTQEANFDHLLQGELSSPQPVTRSGSGPQPTIATRDAFPRVSEILPEEQWGSIDVRVKIVRGLSTDSGTD